MTDRGRTPWTVMGRCAVKCCANKARAGMNYCVECERVAGNGPVRPNPAGPRYDAAAIRRYYGGRS